MDPHWSSKQRPVGSEAESVPASSVGAANSAYANSQSSSGKSNPLDCLPDGRVPESTSSQILSALFRFFYQEQEQEEGAGGRGELESREATEKTLGMDRSKLISPSSSRVPSSNLNSTHPTQVGGRNFTSTFSLALSDYNNEHTSDSSPFKAKDTLNVFSTGATVYSTVAPNYSLPDLGSSKILRTLGKTMTFMAANSSQLTSPLTSISSAPAGAQTEANNQPLEPSYVLEALGEPWQVYLAILYTGTALTSFFLNVITVIVLARSHKCVLRQYLINLSMSDLLMSCFSIPFTYTEYMLGRWIFPKALCPVVRFVVTLSVFVSVATMTVISYSRHLAIMYPFRKKKCSKFRKTHVIMGVWLVGIAISLPEYLMFRAEPFCYNNQIYFDCRQIWPDSISNQYTVFIYLCTFAIPLLLLSYLYIRIGIKMWRRQMPGNSDVKRDLTMQTMRVKVIKMLFVVVILFAVSWLPLQTFSLVLFLFPEIRQDFEYQSTQYNIFIGTYFACHWLSMAHSCLNPLIYCFMNDKFRSDLHDLFCWNARHAYSHHPAHNRPTSLSTTKSFHQSVYANSATNSSNQDQSQNQNQNQNRQSGRHLALSVRDGSECRRSYPGGATGNRVLRFSDRPPDQFSKLSQVITNSTTSSTMTTLVTGRPVIVCSNSSSSFSSSSGHNNVKNLNSNSNSNLNMDQESFKRTQVSSKVQK